MKLKVKKIIALTLTLFAVGSFSGCGGSSGGSSEPITKTCQSCGREFSDSTNKKYIRMTNMCRQCYKNFCYATGREFEEY